MEPPRTRARPVPTGLGVPAAALENQVEAAMDRTIGGYSVIETVKSRANDSPIPEAFSFGLAILSQEGRIADPSAFVGNWRSPIGPEISPWQINPDYHGAFTSTTLVDNFPAYTDYAFTHLLEPAWRKTGTHFDTARYYNGWNACEAGRSEGCRRSKDYAETVVNERWPKIKRILDEKGLRMKDSVFTNGSSSEGSDSSGSSGVGRGALTIGGLALTGVAFMAARSKGGGPSADRS
mgnify:CR=1 FL=1